MAFTKVMKYWTDESDPIYVGAGKTWIHDQFDFFFLFLMVKILLHLASSLRLAVDKFHKQLLLHFFLQPALVSLCQQIILPKQVLKPGSAQEPHNLS